MKVFLDTNVLVSGFTSRGPAELIIDVQKKVSEILAIPLQTLEEGERT